jgi:hypothetical protein
LGVVKPHDLAVAHAHESVLEHSAGYNDVSLDAKI